MRHKKFNIYAEKIAEAFDMPINTIFCKNKSRHIVDARHILYLTCSKKGFKPCDIERLMIKNNYNIRHNSIIHGINIMKDKIKSEDEYKILVDELCTI
tara:strand:- start:326 stop:619 length:294 start_codon:yes stop_codon:yes gene_type:complete